MLYVYLGAGGILLLVLLGVMRRLTSVHVCARLNDVSKLSRMLDRSPRRANERNRIGETPLHQAAKYGNVEAMTILLDRGAEIGAVTNQGVTALHYAVGYAETEAVRLLIDRGADVNVKENAGMTPLDAALMDEPEILRLLQHAGAGQGEIPCLVDLGGDHYVTGMAADDPLLIEAKRRAKAALPTLRSLLKQCPGNTVVKVRQDNGNRPADGLWGRVDSIAGDTLTIRLETQPLGLPKSHDTRQVSIDCIEDWMVVMRDGTFRGGFSYKALFERVIAQRGTLSGELQELKKRLVDM